ncbi:nitroreductase family protein [Desulfosporosinus sp.]|uniref:nitroreductase family protein n=1 Tax=Desulfosporosinus sp. TaxID=157907 RepID=UPI000E9B3A99|nr:nitroreductase family protein [Desulfosporosinus sp.]MBC2723390.1 nitroreductase family protein [Desulfosporosinus sp.]MBC2724945.1 nitroreductase family protein [Desulfosporosinus sp.]HBV87809.1 ferridoxin [Desulfosporosinus sp.]
MSLFKIDQEKCKRDGICARECPTKIIDFTEDRFPTPVKNAEEYCLNCGHCVAVCPHGALTFNNMLIDEYPLVQKDLLPNSETIKQFLTSRRSIRNYQKQAVNHELLAELIDLGRFAPTGSNKQQVHWKVFEDSSKTHSLASLVIDWARIMAKKIPDEVAAKRMERLVSSWEDGVDRIFHGAPHIILTHAPSNLPSVPSDCVIALTYLELYAYSKGLGTCWAGYLTSAANSYAPLTKALGLPEGHKCYGAIMLGYPQFKYHRIPNRNAPLVSWS